MKKKICTTMLYILCSIMFTSPILTQTHAAKKDKPGTAIFVMMDTPCIMTTTKHISKDLPSLYLDIKVPQLHGFSDKRFEKNLNHRFLKEGHAKSEYATKNALTYNKQNLETNTPPLKFEYLSSFTIIESIHPYYVIEFLDYEYSGGAHGLSTQKYIVLDTINNREMALSDFFQTNAPYKEVINNEINQQIVERTKQGEYFFTGTDGFSGITDTTQFYINKLGQLVIVFNVYEIAPYAAGAIEFAIDATTLQDILK